MLGQRATASGNVCGGLAAWHLVRRAQLFQGIAEKDQWKSGCEVHRRNGTEYLLCDAQQSALSFLLFNPWTYFGVILGRLLVLLEATVEIMY